jgi:decaprenyl-phosphate phosphoribosyltransferase
VKNGLVLVAPVASGAVADPGQALRAILGMLAFCMASSAGYLLNDAGDAAADRLHPTKRRRPVARGELGVRAAIRGAAALVLVALGLAVTLGSLFLGTLVAYALLTFLYSRVAKGLAPLDLVVLAAGFLVRAIAGAAVVDVRVTPWFFVLSLVGALIVVAGKRESEMRMGGGPDTRAVLAHYSAGFLGEVRTMGSTLFLVVYCLWAFQNHGETQSAILGAAALPLTVALLRYGMSVHAGRAEAPERLVFEDRTLMISTIGTVVLVAAGLNLV